MTTLSSVVGALGRTMCGIAGAITKRPSCAPGRLTLELTRALHHRGPDGEGFLLAGGGRGCLVPVEALDTPAQIALGHRRLSIVDLESGAQPLANESGSVWVSYNGEIYNHEALRAELVRAGHVFRTRCDTEVLVHGWEEWGTDLFGRLNGIFAFALCDTRSSEVLLVRDPMGAKPLYVGVEGQRTWWSSEIRAAAQAGVLPDTLSSDGLKLLFVFRFVPSPRTVYERVWKVPPRHYCRLRPSDGGKAPRFENYRCDVRSSATPSNRREWLEALTTELEAAVDRQLMADVPVASLLSGGVDSSLVTTLMRERLSYQPHAFAVGFSHGRSELVAASRAAQEIGVPLHVVSVDDDDYIASWPRMVEELGEPIANSSALLLRLLCQRVGQTRKVALSGQGADEPLGGYPRHMAERLYRIGRFFPLLAKEATRLGVGQDSARRLDRVLSAHDRLNRYVQIFAVVPPGIVDRVVPAADGTALELAREAVRRWIPETESADSLNDLLLVDARLSLADDLLIVADHTAMASSVELRVPFLDLAFVDLVERMPSRYKISVLGRRKWLYRQAAARRLPPSLQQELFPRKRLFERKEGFSVPLDAWFNKESGPLREPSDWLNPLVTSPELDAQAVRSIVCGRQGDLTRMRALLYSLSMWLEPRGKSVSQIE